MVDVDVCALYLNKAGDHVRRRVEALNEDLLHYVADLGLQPVVLLQFRDLDADHYVA